MTSEACNSIFRALRVKGTFTVEQMNIAFIMKLPKDKPESIYLQLQWSYTDCVFTWICCGHVRRCCTDRKLELLPNHTAGSGLLGGQSEAFSVIHLEAVKAFA